MVLLCKASFGTGQGRPRPSAARVVWHVRQPAQGNAPLCRAGRRGKNMKDGTPPTRGKVGPTRRCLVSGLWPLGCTYGGHHAAIRGTHDETPHTFGLRLRWMSCLWSPSRNIFLDFTVFFLAQTNPKKKGTWESSPDQGSTTLLLVLLVLLVTRTCGLRGTTNLQKR